MYIYIYTGVYGGDRREPNERDHGPFELDPSPTDLNLNARYLYINMNG
jgi:hypothetical protein